MPHLRRSTMFDNCPASFAGSLDRADPSLLVATGNGSYPLERSLLELFCVRSTSLHFNLTDHRDYGDCLF